MTSSKEIKQLRATQQSLRDLTHSAYFDLANTSDPAELSFSLNGINVVAERTINRFFKFLSPSTSEILALEEQFTDKPTMALAVKLLSKAQELLHKKMNADAVRILTSLTKIKFQDAIILLGTIFMNGVKDRIGKVEFKHPQNALKCLTLGFECGNMESGYLLGTLFRSFGQNEKAKEIFLKNMEKGCIKSTAEITILLQIEAAETTDERKRAILEQKIKNLKVDSTYSAN